MPRESSITLATIKSAVEQLEDEGQKITVRNVHKVTKGDYNRVAALLKEHQDSAAARVQAPAEILEMFAVWADELFTKVHATAEEQFNGSLDVMKGRLATVEAERDEAGAAVTSLTEIGEAQGLEIAELKTDLAIVTKERDQANGQIEAMASQIAQAKADLKASPAERDAQHAATLEKAKARADAAGLDVSSLAEQVAELTKAVEALKAEKSKK